MQVAFDFAFSNKSLTLDAPTPTNNSTNSDAAHRKNGTPASPATDLAKRLFPVPGGPTSKHPFGILAPRAVNLSGFFQEINNLELQFSLICSGDVCKENAGFWDLYLPKFIGPAPPPWDLRNKKKRPPKANNGKNRLPMNPRIPLLASPSDTDISAPVFPIRVVVHLPVFSPLIEASDANLLLLFEDGEQMHLFCILWSWLHHIHIIPLVHIYELRDGGSDYNGIGFSQGVANINTIIVTAFVSKDPTDHTGFCKS